MEPKKVGKFLKKLRNEKGITQQKLAEELKVSGRTVSRWETGSNLPDISLLVEIADFYQVDVREIIEGERKSEMMDQEIKDVANKMADYAGTEKTRLLAWIQVVGVVGVIVLSVALVLQCVSYHPSISSAGAVGATFIALITMAIVTLYVVGVLETIIKRKVLSIVIKTVTIVFLALAIFIISRLVLVFGILGIGFFDYSIPFQKTTGIENYDKFEIVEKYSGDMDSSFMVFPDSTENCADTEYASSIKTGLFDSDGYIILTAKYEEDDFEKELERLGNISCEVSTGNKTVVNKIKYDETAYNYPAYIASDGYDYVYEYALIDRANSTIIYVLLSYPEYVDLDDYTDYLKKDADAYHIKNVSV